MAKAGNGATFVTSGATGGKRFVDVRMPDGSKGQVISQRTVDRASVKADAKIREIVGGRRAN